MNMFINKNSSFISILIELLFLSFYYPINSDDCVTHSFPELNYPTSITLYNDGTIYFSGSGGASHHYISFYSINQNIPQ